MTIEQIERLLDLLARSKAVWIVPDLLNLAEEATSPNNAYDRVFQHTDKRKKALAARWYAVALRDFEPKLVRACVRWLQMEPIGRFVHNIPNLKQFLINALAD